MYLLFDVHLNDLKCNIQEYDLQVLIATKTLFFSEIVCLCMDVVGLDHHAHKLRIPTKIATVRI